MVEDVGVGTVKVDKVPTLLPPSISSELKVGIDPKWKRTPQSSGFLPRPVSLRGAEDENPT